MIAGQSWTVDKLKAKCGELGLKKTGKKQDLIDRINTHVISLEPAPCTSSIDDLTAGLQNVKLKKSWETMTVSELKTELDTFRLSTHGSKEDLIKRLGSYFYPKSDFDIRALGKDRIRVLFVAEKPLMAKELARTLAPNSRYRDRSEHHRKVSDPITILEYSSFFKGIPADFVVTSTFGHVFNEDFQGKQGGKKEEIEELFERKIISTPANSSSLPKKLSEVAQDADVLVLWLDCDLEGEAICFEVLECVKNSMNMPPTGDIMDVVFRARFSAAEDAPKAMNNLIKPNFFQNLANIAKHDLDLRIGVVFSKYQTAILRSKLRSLDVPHVSFGPCQTPCLGFCVERYHKAISHEIKTKYQVVVTIVLDGKKIKINSNNFETKEEAEKVAISIENRKFCEITSIKRTDHSIEPPAGLNTISLLQECSKIHGFSPNETMETAEKLYSRGLISYPRTETTKYPEDLKTSERVIAIKENIGLVDESMDWESYKNSTKINYGIDVGDHQPILPTTVIHGKLNLDEKKTKIYDLISRHFLASFLRPHKYHTLDLIFDLGNGLTFKRKIQKIDDQGYTSLLPWDRVEETEGYGSGSGHGYEYGYRSGSGYRPECRSGHGHEYGSGSGHGHGSGCGSGCRPECRSGHGSECTSECKPGCGSGYGCEGSKPSIVSVKIKEQKTQPPALITESELIGLMEKHRIGTDGSIPGHISNILKRKYVTLDKDSRCLKPTKLGLRLYNSYKNSVPDILNPTLRATVEALLMEIATGKRDFEEVRTYVLDQFKLQFKIFVENFEKFAPDFKDCFELRDPHFGTRIEERIFAKPHKPRNQYGRDSVLTKKNPTVTRRPHSDDSDANCRGKSTLLKRKQEILPTASFSGDFEQKRKKYF